MSNKRYRLLQGIYSPTLSAKAGDIGEQDEKDGLFWFDKGRYYFNTATVLGNKDWFEEVKQQERVTVRVGAAWGNIQRDYLIIVPSKEISSHKYPAIKQAIEQVLNDDVKKYDGQGRGKEWGTPFERLAFWGTHSGWRYCGDCKEPILKLSHFENMVDYIQKDSQPTYNQEQVNKMMEQAFNAAREQKKIGDWTWDKHPLYENVKYWDSRKYITFQDYLSSIKH